MITQEQLFDGPPEVGGPQLHLWLEKTSKGWQIVAKHSLDRQDQRLFHLDLLDGKLRASMQPVFGSALRSVLVLDDEYKLRIHEWGTLEQNVPVPSLMRRFYRRLRGCV